MRKSLYLMNNSYGFFLPYTMAILAISFLVLMTSVSIYRNELFISHRLIEQIKIETLMQMGQEKFKVDAASSEKDNGKVFYSFPHGDVHIDYELVELNQFNLTIKINTNKNTHYFITKRIKKNKR
ncbi:MULTISPECIES: competence type IV pilus minor pilin ComGG [unclassified Virgibacillus]|uniref:competence type IV pilus minor pilin ComGG n=1 Tax=unclassified Virgibacillus TaxID=2620237 RepID=UPI0024DE1AE0|nr:competence type IV pilus minor pilin ComGG [Virgibacillus sp. LDC-1]